VNTAPVKELFGEGIFVADGESWKEQRRVASYEFSSATLRDFSTKVFCEYALKLVAILAQKAKDGEAFDMQVRSYLQLILHLPLIHYVVHTHSIHGCKL
jgi:cytochrome P450